MKKPSGSKVRDNTSPFAAKRPVSKPVKEAWRDSISLKKSDQKPREPRELEEPQARKSHSRQIKDSEFTVCGWNACRRVFEKRPQDILRVFFAPERSRELEPAKEWCRTHKLPYRELDRESLNKAAASVHHEGVVMVVRPVRPMPVLQWVKRGLSPQGFAVALDRVSNTHNLGAVLRSCAYFGAEGLLFACEAGQAVFTPSAARTAEGALEIVPVYDCTDLPSALRDFKAAGMFVLGADQHSDKSIYEVNIRFPCVAVLGNEREGLSDRAKHRCDVLARIPGSGNMESLNVSVAAGVVLAELSRRKAERQKPK